MRVNAVKPNQDSAPLLALPEEKETLELKTEEAVLEKFLWLKALNLNVTQSGYATGWLGYIIFRLAGPEGKEAESAEIGFQLTALPARFLGLITTPIRAAHLCHTRTLMYTSAQVESVCGMLKQLIAHPSEENLQIFREKMKQVTQAYNGLRFSTSDSSYLLIDFARHLVWDIDLVKKVRDYLAEREEPITLWKTEAYLKNQGKRLFNIIMHEFSDIEIISP